MPEYRLRFTKDENLQFLSHLDLLKTMERTIRRAQLPLEYSEGFHPHPKLSFGPALAVGVSSVDEYLDLELTHFWEPALIQEKINHGLPSGMRILEVREILHHVKSLNAIINRASYLVNVKTLPGRSLEVEGQLTELLERNEVQVMRKSKETQKLVNIRPWLHKLTIESIDSDLLRLQIIGEIGSGGNLRPEDLVGAISEPLQIVSSTRTGLWHEDKGQVIKPMDFCGKAGGLE